MGKLWRSNLTGAAMFALLAIGIGVAIWLSSQPWADEKPPVFDVMIDSGNPGSKAHPCATDPNRLCLTIYGWRW